MELSDRRENVAGFYNRRVAIPTRAEVAALVLELEPPRWFVAHSSAVAEIAAFLAARAFERDGDCNRGIVDAAALVHDVDKLVPGLRAEHGDAGAQWLAGRGYTELGAAVAAHPVRRLGDDGWYAAWTRRATIEERIVSYADKRAGQRLESLGARFSRWAERYPEHRESLSRARERAEALERDVCAAAGVRPERVRRLRWVARAFRQARTARR